MGAMLDFLKEIPWYAWIAIVAIIAGAFQKIVSSIHRHEERMAMIKQGTDPSNHDDDLAV